MTAALVTRGLHKDYGDRPALEPLDLEVPQGQHVALVGHNGSGKTTLLRMAAGLLDLATTTTWSSIATVAIIVFIRKMVTRSVARSAGPRPVTPGGQSAG